MPGLKVMLLAVVLATASLWLLPSSSYAAHTYCPEDSRDEDQDRLTNKMECELHTDPINGDTDNDGVLDGQEVMTWKTDPNNPDSDGDGLLDGE